MISSMYEFRENRLREGRSFVMGISETAFTALGPRKKNIRVMSFCHFVSIYPRLQVLLAKRFLNTESSCVIPNTTYTMSLSSDI